MNIRPIRHRSRFKQEILILCIMFFLISVTFWGCGKSTNTEDSPYLQSGAYFVSISGDDSNPGTVTAPWRTITRAATALVAGDSVLIRGGTYSEIVQPAISGKADSLITYAAFPGETVVIDGADLTLPADWGGLFTIYNRSYLVVSGLRIINAGPGIQATGILIDSSQHITVLNNYTYNTVSSGIACWNSSNIIIDGNEVVMACNGGENECLTVASTDLFEVRNNIVHDNGSTFLGGEGLDIKDGCTNGQVYGNHVYNINNTAGLYVDAWDKHTNNISVYNNLIHDIRADGLPIASEEGGLLENIRIYNNIIYNAGMVGISVTSNGLASTHPMENIVIINNTIFNCGDTAWGGGIAVMNPDANNITIRNNLCSQNALFQIIVEADQVANNITVDHNLIDGFRSFDFELFGADSTIGQAAFLNASTADFHITAQSAAYNQGSPTLGPAADYDGNLRPQGAAFDIGAYEVVEQ